MSEHDKVREALDWLMQVDANARRYRYVITRGELPTKTTSGYHYAGGEFHATPEAAIDDAMRGGAE